MLLEEAVVLSKLLYLLMQGLDWIEGGFGLGYCLVSDYCGFEARLDDFSQENGVENVNGHGHGLMSSQER